eukprot:SAG11_NODE_43015_length_171_cov_383.319444_1_plen_36_part_10
MYYIFFSCAQTRATLYNHLDAHSQGQLGFPGSNRKA